MRGIARLVNAAMLAVYLFAGRSGCGADEFLTLVRLLGDGLMLAANLVMQLRCQPLPHAG